MKLPNNKKPFFNLKDYVPVFPVEEVAKIKRKQKELQSRGHALNPWYDYAHGSLHIYRVLKNARSIISRERDRGINAHIIYTMIGLHDFWSGCDIDLDVYNLTKDSFFLKKLDRRRKKFGVASGGNLKKLLKFLSTPRNIKTGGSLFGDAPHFSRLTLPLDEARDLMKEAGAEKRSKIVLELEDKAIGNIREAMKYSQFYKKPKYVLSELKALELDILMRRRHLKRRDYHESLAVSTSLKGFSFLELWLDSMAFPPEWRAELRNFFPLHDHRFIKMDTINGQIAQDADTLDSLSPEAVEKTIQLNSTKKSFFKEAPLVDRLGWDNDVIKLAPDTLTICLACCFKWPGYLNTETAKLLAVKRKIKMENTLRDYISKHYPTEKDAMYAVIDIYKENIQSCIDKNLREGAFLWRSSYA